MAQYLADILGNITGKTAHHIRNSFEFAEEISNVIVPNGCVLYSLDVVSLYTNVPVETVYECIEERWQEVEQHTTLPWPKFKEALKTVLESSFFQYSGSFYKQIYGVPMGSPLSSVVSDLVMEKLEQENMNKLQDKNITLTLYKRYVDDCLLIGREEDIDEVLDVFNSTCDSLQFTVERERDASLRFLDLTLTRTGERIGKKWFVKQRNGRYLDFTSESPHTHKRNTAIALFDRALLLSDIETRSETIGVAKGILRSNNYPEWFIARALRERVHYAFNTLQRSRNGENVDKRFASIPYVPGLSEKIGKALRKHDIVAAYKPADKLKDTLYTKLKDKIDKTQQTDVIYSIPCGACNNKEYIGQTTQTLSKRIEQHKYSVRTNTSVTGLTQHARNEGHVFDFARASVLEKIESDAVRLTAEVLHIKLAGERSVNMQRDSISLSGAYNGLLSKLRETSRRSSRQDRPAEVSAIAASTAAAAVTSPAV